MKDIKERWTDYWPLMTGQAVGNSCAKATANIMVPHSAPKKKQIRIPWQSHCFLPEKSRAKLV